MLFGKPKPPKRPSAGARRAKAQAPVKKRRKPKRPPTADGRNPPPRNPILALFYWGAIVGLWVMAGFVGIGLIFAYDLPDSDGLASLERSPSVTLYAINGEEIATRGDLYGAPVTMEDLPPHLIDAVLATEDRRFYHHFGFDPIGFTRAMVTNIKAGALVQGGSTITQQLAKNVFLTPDRTIVRKIQELMLAFWLEYRFTKDEILTLYLNRVYLGAGTYGVDAAAHKYFGKSATEVTLAEGAMLAGLLKAPSRYSPMADLKRSRDRAAVVLNNMVKFGFVDEAVAQAALDNPASVTASSTSQAVNYYVDWVLDRLTDYVGHTKEDLVVTTTLDPALQNLGDKVVGHWLKTLGDKRKAGQAALISIDHHGAVRAMIGGRDYRKSQFNRAVSAKRQPGSAFKPIVYLAGLEQGIGPNSQMRDTPIILGDWSPKNYDGEYRGPMRVEDALAKSINTVAVKVSEQAGRQNVLRMAKRLGISDELPPHPSLALGTGEVSLIELTGAYQPIAAEGEAAFIHGIVEIREAGSGELLFQREGSGAGQVISRRDARTMTGMLMTVMREGTGKSAQVAGLETAGKTGTSQDFRDAWFVGFSGALVTGVWVGNDDNSPMTRITGGGLPALIWRDYMHGAHHGRDKPRLDPRIDRRRRDGGGERFDDFLNDMIDSLFGGE